MTTTTMPPLTDAEPTPDAADTPLVQIPRPEPSPLAIYAQAIEKGLSVADLKGLLDLHERTEAKKAEAAFAVDMNAAQAEIPAVLKTAQNDFLSSMYAALENLQIVAKPIYTARGFSLVWGEADTPKPAHTRITCDIMHRAGHTKRVFGDYPTDGTGAKGGKNMNAVQGRVSSNTYAQRDMLRSIFNITIADSDDDGNLAGGLCSDEQLTMLYDLRDSLKNGGRPVNEDRLFKWLKITKFEELREADFQKALFYLNDLRKGVKQ